ncbi:MAG: hypothetical protein C0505_00775 [Leptothrix sp. (in: Bacteria)]|nr:hypothetical protein [Leptothrix sp. (in: b-proteobacteria)]
MAHQINLYSPILLAPKRHFSAQAMVQALAVLAVALAALGGWSVLSTERVQQDVAAATRLGNEERARLAGSLAGQPSLPRDSAALEQELAQLGRELSAQRQRLDGLTRGLLRDGQRPSARLALVAQTLPEGAWLTELRLHEEQMTVSGLTLLPAALKPWMDKLGHAALAAGQALPAVKVERAPSLGPGAAAVWSFQLGAAAPAAGVQR